MASVIVFAFILCLLFAQCHCVTLENWTLSDTIFPVSSSQAICGYNSIAQKLFVLGGIENKQNLMSFDLSCNKLTTHSPLSLPINCYSQCYAQYGEKLYFVQSFHIGVFNMNSYDVQYPLSPTLNARGQEACVTISEDGRYLFIVSGRSSTNANGTLVEQFDEIAVESVIDTALPLSALYQCSVSAGERMFVTVNNNLYWTNTIGSILKPTNYMTCDPTRNPTTRYPTITTQEPSYAPTEEPSYAPTEEPSYAPTESTQYPTEEPSANTIEPSIISTDAPTRHATNPTSDPIKYLVVNIESTFIEMPSNNVKKTGENTFTVLGMIAIVLLILIFCFCIICFRFLICWLRGSVLEDEEIASDEEIETDQVDIEIMPGATNTRDTNAKHEKKEMKEWLTKIGMQRYYKNFIKNGFENMTTIAYIDDQDLMKELGIKLIGHRILIWTAIKKLNPEGNIVNGGRQTRHTQNQYMASNSFGLPKVGAEWSDSDADEDTDIDGMLAIT